MTDNEKVGEFDGNTDNGGGSDTAHDDVYGARACSPIE